MKGGINSCADFLKWVLPELEKRPEGYRKVRKHVCKRLLRRMGELNLHSFESYRRFLDDNPAEWKVTERRVKLDMITKYQLIIFVL